MCFYSANYYYWNPDWHGQKEIKKGRLASPRLWGRCLPGSNLLRGLRLKVSVPGLERLVPLCGVSRVLRLLVGA